ncbi:hypothetical protein WJX74_004043 [Apatococcus lobatus]|uniref:Uncharacterized protein n=1 Tax=Apatococcus lobatus TaxID=904363 RepID=A0AAW1RYC4_9CHLO
MTVRADYQRLHSFLSPSRRNPEQRQEATKHINEPDVNEVLNIARNSLIGSSAVFAGLLSIPFAPNFKDLEEASEHFYLTALVLQLAAVACFLCTSIISVIGGEEAFWRLARPALFTGFGCFACALSIIVGVVAQYVHSNGLAFVLSILCLIILAFAWGVLPWLSTAVDS